MYECRRKINKEKNNNEAGFIRLVITICLLMAGFLISLLLIQSFYHRMASSSLLDRLPIALILLLLCALVFAYARLKRGGDSKDPDKEEEED